MLFVRFQGGGSEDTQVRWCSDVCVCVTADLDLQAEGKLEIAPGCE